ncbi:hypothetical protein [Streptomyces sp. NPDC023838]|uniref:hypothetical protein n=1 Tax=Streptomyces sp. NPDC023838 TaxID=3154325 RepID=UPI0033DFEF0A
MSNDARYAIYVLLGGGPIEPAARTAALDAMQAADFREGADHIAAQADQLWAPGRTAHTVMHADAAELRRMADELEAHARKAEPAAMPLAVFWDRFVMGPSGDTDDENTLIPCMSADGQPVALVLDDELRLRLAVQLAGPGHRSLLAVRLAVLAREIDRVGGQWTTRRAQRFYRSIGIHTPTRQAAREDLKALHRIGFLQSHGAANRHYYTPAPQGGGAG